MRSILKIQFILQSMDARFKLCRSKIWPVYVALGRMVWHLLVSVGVVSIWTDLNY